MNKPLSLQSFGLNDEFTEAQCLELFLGNLKSVKLTIPQSSYAVQSLQENKTIGLKFPKSWQSLADKAFEERKHVEEKKNASMATELADKTMEMEEETQSASDLEEDIKSAIVFDPNPHLNWLKYSSLHLRQELSAVNFDRDTVKIDHKLISSNPLQYHFTRNLLQKDNFHISFMKTRVYYEIKQILEKGERETIRPSCLLLGNMGIGKSFGLALNVLELRKNGDYLIFYINNANFFSADYFINEILYTLLETKIEDEIPIFFENLCEEFELDSNLSKEAIWKQVARTLRRGTPKDYPSLLEVVQRTFRKPLLNIIDQAPFIITGKYAPEIANLILELLRVTVSSSTVILCSSSYPPEEYDPILPRRRQHFLSGGFTANQAREFLMKNLRKDWRTQETSLKALVDETQYHPYELYSFCKLARKEYALGFSEILKIYQAEQEREIKLIHVVPKRKAKWISYLTLSYLHRPLQSEDYDAIDESLCRFEEKENSGSLELKFCHPRYEEILRRKYDAEIELELTKLLAP